MQRDFIDVIEVINVTEELVEFYTKVMLTFKELDPVELRREDLIAYLENMDETLDSINCQINFLSELHLSPSAYKYVSLRFNMLVKQIAIIYRGVLSLIQVIRETPIGESETI